MIKTKESEIFNELSMSFHTIIITNHATDYIFSENLATVFQKLITNAQIIRIINEVIKKVTGKNSKYDISSTKLAYFSTQISQLYGYAGINEIYLNIQLLNLFYLNLSKKYQHDDKITILNLIFAKIVVHEITHVALRLFKAKIDWIESAEKEFNLD